MLVTLFLSYIKTECTWENQNPNNQYCRTTPFTADCTGIVTYDLGACLIRNSGEYDYDYNYNIKVNLQNPVENPFLVNVTFYTEITIENGYLVTVPKDVYKMTKLTDIKLSKNKFRKINFNDFLPLPNLKRIDLSNNTIIILESVDEFSEYSSVQDIDVSFNFIEAVPNNFVKKFRELEHLNLSHNLIAEINRHAFEGAVQLKTLDLSVNRLREVGNIFAQLPKLLDLNYETSRNLQKLSKLVLDYNIISDVNFTEFFDTGIPELSIGGNQIPCNELAKIKYSKYSDKFDRTVTAQFLYISPNNINGISCRKAQNEIKDIMIVSDNPSNSNSSILISLLKNSVINNGKSIDSLIEVLNQNEKKLEQFMEKTNSTLININNQLREIKEKIFYPSYSSQPDKFSISELEDTSTDVLNVAS